VNSGPVTVERGEWTTFRAMRSAGIVPKIGTLWEIRKDPEDRNEDEYEDENCKELFVLTRLRHSVFGDTMVEGVRLAGYADGAGIDLQVRSVVVVMRPEVKT